MHIKVETVEEHEDGSATVTFDADPEVIRMFASQGILVGLMRGLYSGDADGATVALAEAWASIDGKLEEFNAERTTAEIGTGTFAGYVEEAKELRRRLLDRGFALNAI